MKKKDFILALLVVVIWGANFTVIKLGLGGVPSMLLVSLRYLSVLPALFFVKKPELDWLMDFLLECSSSHAFFTQWKSECRQGFHR